MGTTTKTLYDTDFADWCALTAELVRSGRLAEVDLEHVAEEIEDMGKRDRRAATNRTRVLILHLLKWAAQPDKRSPSWKTTIVEQRRRLNAIFEDSGSIRSSVRGNLGRIYQDASQDALLEMGLSGCLPCECLWSLEQILDTQFFPDAISIKQK
jgi:hypothetical protein